MKNIVKFTFTGLTLAALAVPLVVHATTSAATDAQSPARHQDFQVKQRAIFKAKGLSVNKQSTPTSLINAPQNTQDSPESSQAD